jgi:hypothetical protein
MTPEKQLSESLLAACKAAGIHNPRYIAQNANGKVIHHDESPTRQGWTHIWGNGGPPKRLNHPPYADNWQDSLLQWVEPQSEPLADVLAQHGDTSKKVSGIEALVCEDIAKRQQVGIAKYGTTVAENMLSHTEWLQHAYEECLDMAVYLKRAMAELQTTCGKIEIENEDY